MWVYLEQKFLTDEASTAALQLPKKRSWSYSVWYGPMFLLNSARWFDISTFLGLCEQLSSHFVYCVDLFLWKTFNITIYL